MTDPNHDQPELGLPEDDEDNSGRPAPGLDADGWHELVAVLDRVPFVAVIKRDLQSLARLVYERRLPRLAFVATADVGIAPLLAALLEIAPKRTSLEGGWLRLDAEERHLEVLAAPPLEAVDALRESTPDVLFLVASAAEVDAGLGHHLDAVVRVLAGTRARAERVPAFIPILVQAPPVTAAPARASFGKQLAEAGLPDVEVTTVGLCEGLAPVGVESLAERIVETLPDPARVEGARALAGARRARRRVAAAITRASSTLAVTVAVAPVPLADLAILAPLQALLVTSIAYLSGRPWDRGTALEWVGSVGAVGAAGLGLRWGAQQAVKAVPGLGSLVSASIAGAGTLAIGRSAGGYFLRD